MKTIARIGRGRLLAGAALALGVAQANAATVLYGPSPYLSEAGSPFAGTAFDWSYLEDFEDGQLNVPGVSVSSGIVAGPTSLTDSVDGDSGPIDGSGTSGHSWYSQFNAASFTFTFSAQALGALPTHAGIVWTDVGETTSGPFYSGGVTFEAFDALGASLGMVGPQVLGDGVAAGGQTAEDRFFGVYHSGGLSAIRIAMTHSVDWEVDHLQYGLAPVPEPSRALLAAVGVLLVGGWTARRRRR